MNELLVSDEFKHSLDGCSADLKKQVLDKIRRLAADPAHPGLNTHRIKGAPGMWECYVNLAQRIIFDWNEAGAIRLWKLGDKRIIQRVQRVFSPHTPFSRLEILHPEPAEEETAAGQDTASAPAEHLTELPAEADNPFMYFSAAHLRLLGVPADLVKEVQRTRRLEELEKIPGLPSRSLQWLLELATDCRLEHVIYNPDNLLFRTTLDRLSGYCQGSIRRLMLNLDPEQDRHIKAEREGETVLRGCAGSGKTTVAIYRAIEEAQKGRRVLLLTFNRTLNRVNKTLIEELIGPLPANLEVKTFYEWLVPFLSKRLRREFSLAAQPKELVERALQQARQRSDAEIFKQGAAFFDSEIQGVIKGNGLNTLEEYLRIRRHGRNTPLPPSSRRAVWEVYTIYCRQLEESGCCDWLDLSILGLEELRRQPLDRPYDDVIVDEGQDLHPVQLRLTRELIRGGDAAGRRTYMVLADASQTIYSRGFSWKEAGIEARGRTAILRKNYRNTRQIAAAAAALISRNRLLQREKEFIEPAWTERYGPRPRVVICDSEEREKRFVCERILDLIGDGRFRPADFALLCPTNDLCREYRDELSRRGLPCAVHRDEIFNILEEQVKIMTIHSAKGIEFPVVFVPALRRGILPRRFNRQGLDPEEAQLEEERQRILLYVAVTRAAESLFLVTTAGRESPFLAEMDAYSDKEDFPSP